MLPVALVLTAGLGTRLRPLSFLRAKPAMPVGGTPLVERILRWLAASGVQEAILNLHHRADTITRIVGTGEHLGLRVRYSWEDPILGSAGGPRRAFMLTREEQLLVVNGDTLTDPDLGAVMTAHRESDALVTLAAVDQPEASAYGGLRAEADGSYAGPAGPGAGLHFIGVQIVRRQAFAGVADGEVASTINGVYEPLSKSHRGRVRVFRTRAGFLDIGTPATYLAACLAVGEHAHAAVRSHVAPSAQLDRCVLWDDVVIEDDVQLTECIVTDGVAVPRGSRYHRAVLMRAGVAPPAPDDQLTGNLHVAPIDRRGR